MMRSVARRSVVGRSGRGGCWSLLSAGARRASRKSARKAASPTSPIAAEKTYVAPGDLDEYYMFSSGGHSGQIYVYGLPSMRHLVDDSGLHALSRHRLRLRRRHEDDAGRADLGRRAPPGAVGNQGRLRRPLALHQRDERPRGPDRPPRLQDQADLRTGAERVGQSRIGVRHAEHRVQHDGDALLDSHPEGHLRADRQIRHRLQGRRRGHQDRSEERRDVARLGSPDAAVRLRPRRRRQARVRRLDVLELVQHRARHRQARGHGQPARPRLHRRRQLARGREGRGRRDRAT